MRRERKREKVVWFVLKRWKHASFCITTQKAEKICLIFVQLPYYFLTLYILLILIHQIPSLSKTIFDCQPTTSLELFPFLRLIAYVPKVNSNQSSQTTGYEDQDNDISFIPFSSIGSSGGIREQVLTRIRSNLTSM